MAGAIDREMDDDVPFLPEHARAWRIVFMVFHPLREGGAPVGADRPGNREIGAIRRGLRLVER